MNGVLIVILPPFPPALAVPAVADILLPPRNSNKFWAWTLMLPPSEFAVVARRDDPPLRVTVPALTSNSPASPFPRLFTATLAPSVRVKLVGSIKMLPLFPVEPKAVLANSPLAAP